MSDIGVNPGGVGPIGLDGDNRKSMLLDQPPGDRRSSSIEFRRPVSGFAEQDNIRIGEAIEMAAEFFGQFRRGQWF
jgi:hypothetical protein